MARIEVISLNMKQSPFISFFALVFFSQQSFAALNVAVASNFKFSAQQIAEDFEQESGIKVNLSSASTATLYKQILQGAPFDLFLAADEKHTQLLVEQNKVENEQPFVYAKGRLVFWKPEINRVPTLQDVLQYQDRLAIANPKFAPYGIAAQQTLQSIDKWQANEYVQGNNVNQAYQFVDSKNVKAGLLSYASMIQQHQRHYVIIPEEWHQPIIQSGLILDTKSNEDVVRFKQYLLSAKVQQYIRSQGYN